MVLCEIGLEKLKPIGCADAVMGKLVDVRLHVWLKDRGTTQELLEVEEQIEALFCLS